MFRTILNSQVNPNSRSPHVDVRVLPPESSVPPYGRTSVAGRRKLCHQSKSTQFSQCRSKVICTIFCQLKYSRAVSRYPPADSISLTDSDSQHSGSLPNGYRQSDISMYSTKDSIPNSPTKPRFIERGVPEGAASVSPQDVSGNNFINNIGLLINIFCRGQSKFEQHNDIPHVATKSSANKSKGDVLRHERLNQGTSCLGGKRLFF